MKMLIVDADTRFAGVLATGLTAYGNHEVDISPPQGALRAIGRKQYAVAVVEYRDGGSEFLHKFREVDPLLVALVVTAEPDYESAVEFLRGGPMAPAIDYIEKPEMDLIKRIHERATFFVGVVEVADWTADRRERQGYYRDESLDLIGLEFIIFLMFMLHPNEYIRYSVMAMAIYGRDVSEEDAYTTLRSTVSRLRRKVNRASGFTAIGRHLAGRGIAFSPRGTTPRRRQATSPELDTEDNWHGMDYATVYPFDE